MKITDKREMYDLLYAGRFGNRNIGYRSLDEWQREHPPGFLWGVRSTKAGDLRTAMHVGEDRVPEAARTLGTDLADISVMLDSAVRVTAMIQVLDGVVEYVPSPRPGVSWRVLMPQARKVEGVTAVAVLDHFLNGPSREDLRELQELYPAHVIEMSTTATPFGTHPHRNAVLWEVRCADGTYEKW